MIQAGEEVEKHIDQGGKGKIDQILESQSYDFLPAAEDLQSIIAPDQPC